MGYFFIVYLLISPVFYTMTVIAYNSMLALVRHDKKDQADMSAYSQIFAMASQKNYTDAPKKKNRSYSIAFVKN